MAIRRNPGDMPGRNWGSHTRGAAASAARSVGSTARGVASYYSDTARSVPRAVSQVPSVARRVAGSVGNPYGGGAVKQRRSLKRYNTLPKRRTSSRVPRGRGASRR